MAAQNANPPPWDDSMSDGCSGAPDYGYKIVCKRHDHRYFLGGDETDKAFGDDKFYLEMQDPRYVKSWFWRAVARGGLARVRWAGLRFITINYPPGHRLRRLADDSREVFNWLGTANEDELT